MPRGDAADPNATSDFFVPAQEAAPRVLLPQVLNQQCQ